MPKANPLRSYSQSEKNRILVRQNYQRYTYARDNGHLEFTNKARRCDEFFRGKQWSDLDRQKVENQGRPALTINKVLPAVAAILGEQMNEVADIGFKPARNGNMDTANALNKTFIHISNWNRLSEIEADVFEDGVITSRGYFDARLDFTDNIFGDIRITKPNPRNIILDPDAEEYDPQSWKDVQSTKWLSIQDLELMYSKKAANELRNMAGNEHYLGYDFLDVRPDTFGGERTRFNEFDMEGGLHEYRRVYRVLERQYRKVSMQDHFVDLRNGDVMPISPEMPREKINLILQQFDVTIVPRRVEQIFWCVTCNDYLLHHEASPYRNFTVTPFFPFFRHGQTIGLVENMIDPQEMYNKTRSQELHVINTTANSGWQAEEGQTTNMTDEELEERGAETGLVIIRQRGTPPLEKITPNQIPSGLDRFSYVLAEDMKELSMASDSMRGFDRADVAAKAIQAKQAQGSTNFTKILHNLNKSRMLLARNILDMVQDFYLEERVLQITGGSAQKTEELVINEITPEGKVARDLSAGKYEVVVTSVPARETFEESQFQQAIQLKELGVNIPDTILISASHLPGKQELLEQMSDSAQPSEEEQAAMQLEMQLKQLEAQKMEAETAKTRAETMIAMIEAQQNSGEEGQQLMTMEDKIAMDKARNDLEAKMAELELKKYEIDQQTALKREELAIKQKEMRQKHMADVIKLRSSERQADKQLEAKKAESKAKPMAKKTESK